MRSRRQGVSDAVSVLGMDPWKDDRVRDFVAINTIQRLRAYHLARDAPMPPVEAVNADRALNLLLLPRAEPDYRSCMGEASTTPADDAQGRRGRRTSTAALEPPNVKEMQDGEQQVAQTAQVSCRATSPASSSSNSSFSEDSDDEEDEQHKRSREEHTTSYTTDESNNTLAATNAQPAGLTVPADETPKRPHHPDLLSPSPEARRHPSESALSSSSVLCAVDRARALFFGAASFHSSTSPRRLINSPHVPVTPSVTSQSPAMADRPSSSADGLTPLPSSDAARTEAKDDEGRVRKSTAARSLNSDLDAYIEANSTPLRLRPPPPMPVTAHALKVESDEEQKEEEAHRKEEEETKQLAKKEEKTDEEKKEVDAAQSPLDTTSTAERRAVDTIVAASGRSTSTNDEEGGGCGGDGAGEETAPHTGEGQEGDEGEEGNVQEVHHQRSCDVCEAIIQYYQSMLNRGVVLDRYNHKDLAFAWWVLGRNMDTAALEQRGPMRREALLITIRNLYYGLLSAEEAKAKEAAAAAAAAAETPSIGSIRGETPVKSKAAEQERIAVEEKATGAEEPNAMKEPTVATSGRTRGRGREPATPTVSATTTANAAVLAAPTRKRTRAAPDDKSNESGDGADKRKDSVDDADTRKAVVEPDSPPLSDFWRESAKASTIAMRAHMKLPPMPSMRGKTASTGDVVASTSAATSSSPSTLTPLSTTTDSTHATEPVLAAALRGTDGSADTLVGNEAIKDSTATKKSDDGDGDDDDDSVEARGSATAATSLASSATASRAGSVTPAETAGPRRRRRRAEERRRAVEETWTSSRPNRRTSAAATAALGSLPSDSDKSGAEVRGREGKTPATAQDEDAREEAGEKHIPVTQTKETHKAGSKGVKGTVNTKAKPKSSTATASAKRARSPSIHQDSDDLSSTAQTEKKEKDEATALPVAPAEEPAKGGRKPRGKAANASAVKKDASTDSTTITTTKNTAEPGGKVDDAALMTGGKGTTASSTTDGPSTAVASVTSAASSAVAPAAKKGKQPGQVKEEHRGRPRGSFKVPRPPADGSATAVGVAGVGRAVDKKRADATAAAAAAATTTSATTAGTSSSSSAASTAPHRPSSASTAATQAHESTTNKAHTAVAAVPPPKPAAAEMPVGLTAHERAVRTRIQQRMGVALPPPPPPAVPGTLPSEESLPPSAEAADGSGAATVYSSYTFLLTSFASPGQPADGKCGSATTAPVLWYGNAVPAATKAKTAEISDAPAAPAARMRGRKRKIEGGVDRAALGPPLRHDQAALEEHIRARKARETADAPPPDAPKAELTKMEDDEEERGGGVVTPNSVAVKAEPLEESPEEMTDTTAAEASAVVPPVTSSASVNQSPPSSSPPPTADGDAEQTTADDTTGQPPREFSDLTYAQQCLLVWTAGGLLERDAHRRHVAEARKERLLARCGRMATRRMAARVAAVVEHTTSRVRAQGKAASSATSDLLAQTLADDAAEVAVVAAAVQDAVFSARSHRGALAASLAPSGDDEGSRSSVPPPTQTDVDGSGGEEDESGDDSDASSVTSAEAFRQEVHPLPRQFYDYWSAYRSRGGAGHDVPLPNVHHA